MPGYTVLICPTCGGKTSVHADSQMADCMYCGNQIILRPVEMLRANVDEPRPAQRPITPAPANVTVEQDGAGITLRRRWYSPKYIFMAVFSLFWDGFLVVWFWLAIGNGAPLLFVLFPLLHVAVGFYLTYSTLAGFLNTTTLRLTPNELAVTHDPLPWSGEVTLNPSELEQLYTREITRRTKNGISTSYTLSAVTRDGRKLDLLQGADAPETCLFMERQIEDWLRIPNQGVAGEYR